VTSRAWDGKGVFLAARDSGPGIPAGLIEKVFTPSFSTKPEGLVGLSLRYASVRRCCGHITVESGPGRGTGLRVRLLAEPAIGDEDSSLAEQLEPTGGGPTLRRHQPHESLAARVDRRFQDPRRSRGLSPG
jgi:hypothetical protein